MNSPQMEWRNIEGYPGYWISEEGKIQNKKCKILRQWLQRSNAKEYWYVCLWLKNKKRNLRVHRLVAIAFLSNPYRLPEVDHKDRDTMNCHKDNLQWASTSYNNSVKAGRSRYLAREEAERERLLENA